MYSFFLPESKRLMSTRLKNTEINTNSSQNYSDKIKYICYKFAERPPPSHIKSSWLRHCCEAISLNFYRLGGFIPNDTVGKQLRVSRKGCV
jgi:hypothetical protein